MPLVDCVDFVWGVCLFEFCRLLCSYLVLRCVFCFGRLLFDFVGFIGYFACGMFDFVGLWV